MGCLLYSMLFQAGCSRPLEPIVVYEVPNGFLLGPEDELEITVWKNQDLSRTTIIRPDGLISMP
ncbi:MAG: polysaccharide biosynthesis/export family protein, partial [Nitrospirota bacterium]